MANKMVTIFNTIWAAQDDTYKARIPQATQDNIDEVSEAMHDGSNYVQMNQFYAALYNVLAFTQLKKVVFKNKLAPLKKGKKIVGDSVQELFISLTNAEAYDPEGLELLSRKLPDIKTVYHRMNRQDKYKTTVNRAQSIKAFKSWDILESTISTQIGNLYTSNEWDEFLLMKNVIKEAFDSDFFTVVDVAEPLEKANAEDFVKAIKTYSGLVEYPSSDYNGYLRVQDTDTKPLVTTTPKSKQVIIIDTATDVSVGIDVLAHAFHLSPVEFNETKKIVIDAFPIEGVRAILVDEDFFQVYDDMFAMESFRNPEGLYDSYILHAWQTYGYSPFVNAIAFRVKSDEAGA